jgi:3-methyl-2-oxobutanoate hydroxymethyltransferase
MVTRSAKAPVNKDAGVRDNGSPAKQVTVPDFLAAKGARRLVMLTAYDYSTARLLDDAGVDSILVGDSLGMVVQGNATCLSVTLEEMIYHTRLVARGVRRSLLVSDMPFMSFQVSPEQATANAGRLVKEGSAHAVKLEGGARSRQAIAAIVQADIPVVAHIGMTPQSVRRFGGFRVQRDEERLLEDARAAEEAGAFAMVIECVPAELAAKITASVRIPTIGIGAGAGCDGQVLVLHDLLGMYPDFRPRFAKTYANLGEEIRRAVGDYCREVRGGTFPGEEYQVR